jgi:protease-4
MGEEAASGGYYLSCAADRIYANANTTTGSIGVILHLMYLQGLYDKIGVKEEVIKSAPHKDIGSRPLTAEEHKILQDLIDDAYGGFLDVVANRPGGPWHGDVNLVKPLADGSVFSGKRALDKGLVDRIGDLKEAELGAAELAGIKGTPQIELLESKTSFFGTVQNRLATDPTQLRVSLPQLGTAGPGYFLEYLALPPGD